MAAAAAPIPETPHAFVATLQPIDRVNDPILSALPFHLSVESSNYRVDVAYAERAMLSIDGSGRIVILGGTIYRPQSTDLGQMLLALYERLGPAFARELDGDYALLLIDPQADQILFVTDRLNAVKLLVSTSGSTLIVSNAMGAHPIQRVQVDSTAAACYLVSGFTYTDRTLLEGVRMLEGGSIYRPHGITLAQQVYWHYLPPDTPSSPALVARIQEEMEAAIVEAVRCRVSGDRPVYLSLSAGYDSRAILGVLKERLHIDDVRPFTYAYGKPQPGTDEALAPALAAHYNAPHRLVQSFNGRLVEMLTTMAQMSQGMTDISDETDAWLTLGSQIGDRPRPLMLTGDILITRDLRFGSVDDALTCAKLFDFGRARWLEPLIGHDRYNHWLEQTRSEQTTALRRCPPTSNYYVLHDMLRVHARHPHVFSTWRANFAGRFFDVANPLMDSRVVELFMNMPLTLQRDKTLYHRTLRAMFPALFALPRANVSHYASYWPAAFHEQADDIRAWIDSEPSPFDDLVEPKILLTLLGSDLLSFARPYTAFRTTIQSVYRLLTHVGIEPGFAHPSLLKKAVPAHRILSRALVLRHYFRSVELRQRGSFTA